jgi:hypothetical protein
LKSQERVKKRTHLNAWFGLSWMVWFIPKWPKQSHPQLVHW